MHRLKIRRHEVSIAPGHFKRAVTQDLLQMEHGPAAPQIENGEGVPECVEGATWRSKPKLLTKPFDASQGAHAKNVSSLPCGEKQTFGFDLEVSNETVKHSPQSEAKRDDSLLPSLPV
jgi:hypothetical protein